MKKTSFTPHTLPQLCSIIVEDYRANGSDATKPGFLALLVHRFGNYRMNQPKLLRLPMTALYRTAFTFIRNFMGIELPFSAAIGRRFVIEHQGGIVVHGDTVVGDDCVIRQGVTLGNKNMDQPFDAPTLGNRVNVGAGAVIAGKVTVGDGATVGANSVVVRDVPSGDTVVGVPARSMHKRAETAASIEVVLGNSAIPANDVIAMPRRRFAS